MKRETADAIVEYVRERVMQVYEDGNDFSVTGIDVEDFDNSCIDRVLKIAAGATMTTARHPHPQRCDHHLMCGITLVENCNDTKCKWYSPPSKKPGCFTTCPFNDLAANDVEKIQEIQRISAKAEREQVLDKIIAFCKSNDCVQSTYGDCDCIATTDNECIICFAESLRAQQEER